MFWWSADNGLFDDLHGAGQRILMDDDQPPTVIEMPPPKKITYTLVRKLGDTFPTARYRTRHPRVGGDPVAYVERRWIPAYAGTTAQIESWSPKLLTHE